ncbi:hypothetical protein FB451DRAFT_1252057 [Mycena latifolia]|nr:hypothetical protein FB451DRAFT_1252057 [Mycena latifolia]
MPMHRAPESASLMSIVEGVARANRDGWAVHNNSNTSAVGGGGGSINGSAIPMEVKAPRLDAPTVRGRSVSGPPIDGLPRAGPTATLEGIPRAPGSVFSTPAVPSTFSGPEMLLGATTTPGTSSAGSSLKRPAKSPLRSALRAASPPPVPPTAAVKSPAREPPPAAVPVPIPVPAPVLNGVGTGTANGKGKGKATEPVVGDDDSGDGASISSYETGHETFEDEEGEETEHEEEHPPPPPPHEYGVNGGVLHESPIETSGNNLIEDYGYGGSDLSASSASTAPAVPQRRKSVRVSLQPTFSATPPAIDEDEDDDEEGGDRHAPWGDGPGRGTVDMWEDSSEEDVEYQKAKRLLSRVARKDKKAR